MKGGKGEEWDTLEGGVEERLDGEVGQLARNTEI